MYNVQSSSSFLTWSCFRWHLGSCSVDYLPNKRGFDTFDGFLLGREDYFTHYLSANGMKENIGTAYETYRYICQVYRTIAVGIEHIVHVLFCTLQWATRRQDTHSIRRSMANLFLILLQRRCTSQ